MDQIWRLASTVLGGAVATGNCSQPFQGLEDGQASSPWQALCSQGGVEVLPLTNLYLLLPPAGCTWIPREGDTKARAVYTGASQRNQGAWGRELSQGTPEQGELSGLELKAPLNVSFSS